MPVESEQAQAARPVTEQLPAPAQPPAPAPGEPRVGEPAAPEPPRVAAPRPPHDEHELPDGRYLIAYGSAPNA